ncbi:hypothetical protein NPA08_03720 [Mycoplasmopsis citelli]|uniref:hypothetical protein n=1 Tax=Mycoplasmopsis citelli TaxID=171281 RepID=UPI002115A79B|nr:hypothetical protein [Mycoplasmopsis citelli]UUD36035.1 hypothetical protein NPA08_03720 [Mycoplasmopsis citelli]
MKRNRLLKHLFILATPAIISIASVSCSSPTTPPQKGDGSQGTPGNETTPPPNNGAGQSNQEPGTQPQPEVQNPSDPDDQKGKETPAPNPGTGTAPSLSASFQQLKAQIQKLSLYNEKYTKEDYAQYFKNLKDKKDSFVNSKYTAEQFEKDTTLLEKYYSQALDLLEILKTKGDAEVKEYIDSLKSQGDSIFKVENEVTTVNVLEINSLQSKLNSQNAKKVEEKYYINPRFTFTTKGSALSSKLVLLTPYVQKVIQQLSNLSLYSRGNTTQKYNQLLASLKKEDYVKDKYTEEHFNRDLSKLKLAYAQIAVLDANLNTMNDLDLMKYLKEQQNRENSIVKSVEEPSLDYQSINQLFLNIITSGSVDMQAEDIKIKKELQRTTGLLDSTQVNQPKMVSSTPSSGSATPAGSSTNNAQGGTSNPGTAPATPSGPSGASGTPTS